MKYCWPASASSRQNSSPADIRSNIRICGKRCNRFWGNSPPNSCDCGHIPLGNSLPRCECSMKYLAMRPRPMAALLVLTMVSWVGSFAQTAGTSAHAKPVAQFTPDSHATDNCCPPLQEILERFIPDKREGMPCGDTHPCCVRPELQNTPNLPSSCKQQESSLEESAIFFVVAEDDPILVEAHRQISTPRPLKFSTVLQI